MKSLAAVLVEPRKLEMQHLEVPKIAPDSALLQVEVCGLCGTDVEQYDGAYEKMGVPYPFILGHEPVGRIAEIGAEAAKRWGVAVGDRVAIEPVMGCGYCRACLTGKYSQCRRVIEGTKINSYGCVPTTTGSGLWGGYSEYMHLDPHTVMHKVDPALPLELVALYQPIAAGIRWFVHDSNLKLGDTIVILGCGQRGIAGVLAARHAGAGMVIATGLAVDEHKLALARRLGADATIVADREDVVARVMELTKGEGADVVVDVAAVSMQPIADAIQIAKKGGTIVLAATKGSGATMPGFIPDLITLKELTMKGLLSQDTRAFEPALRMIESRRYPLEEMHTHTFPLEDAAKAVETLAGRVPGEKAIHVMLAPPTTGRAPGI